MLALNTPLPKNDRTDMAQQLVSVAARKRQCLIILPFVWKRGLPSIEQSVFNTAVFSVLL